MCRRKGPGNWPWPFFTPVIASFAAPLIDRLEAGAGLDGPDNAGNLELAYGVFLEFIANCLPDQPLQCAHAMQPLPR